MNQVRELVFYKNHFHDFFNKQSEKAKEKIDHLRSWASTFCWSCRKDKDKEGTKLTQCSQCYSVWYCSKECQSKDWKEGKHKIDCKKV